MKRYWLFAAYDYEAIGGLDDLKATGNDVTELKTKANSGDEDNAWIVDTKTWQTIWSAYFHFKKKKYEWKPQRIDIKVLQNEGIKNES